MNSKAAAISASQSQKALNGSRRSKVLEEVFTDLQRQGLLKSFKAGQHFPYVFSPSTSDRASPSTKLAGYAPFLLERPSGRFIVVFSSTSYRLDRTYGNQEDAKRILEHSSITGQVDCTVFLLDDSPGNTTKSKNEDAMVKLQASIDAREIHSYVDQFMPLSAFPDFLKALP